MLGLLGEATAITWADLSSVFSEITGQFTIANMVGVLKGAFGIAILFVFFWFGIKKGLAIVNPSINNGTMASGGAKRRK